MRLVREPVHPQFLFSVHLLRHPHATSFLDSWRKYLASAVPSAPERPAVPRVHWQGMPSFRLVSEYAPAGDQPRRDRAPRRTGSPRGRPHAVLLGVTGSRQDLHARQRHRAASAARRWSSRRTRRWPPSSTASSRRSSRRTRSSTSSPTTTTTSPRPTSRSRTPTSRRTRSSTTRSTGCATRRPRRSSSGATWWWSPRSRASTASARPRPTTACTSRWRRRAGAWSATHIIRRLVALQYERNDYDFRRGTFRVRGDVVEIFPAAAESGGAPRRALGRHVERHPPLDPLQGAAPGARSTAPRDLPGEPLRDARRRSSSARCGHHQDELGERLALLPGAQSPAGGAAARAAHALRHGDAPRDRLLPRHRELLAPPLRAASRGRIPPTLIDYLPEGRAGDHRRVATSTVPQLRGMYTGDRSRKEALVEYGFRLPSAFDNRPLTFDEFTARGAARRSTSRPRPGPYELAGRRQRRAGQP